ncbi:MAG: hypothetical protein Q7R30_13380 [Acidobacteriota bacterium]|nr:hypothetical protein [Acidobacteriota bacterium]
MWRTRSPRRAELVAQPPLARTADGQQHDVPELLQQRAPHGRKAFRRPRRGRPAGAGADTDQHLIRPYAEVIQDAAANGSLGVRHGQANIAEQVAGRVGIDNAQQAKRLVLDVPSNRAHCHRPRRVRSRVVPSGADHVTKDDGIHSQLPDGPRWRE